MCLKSIRSGIFDETHSNEIGLYELSRGEVVEFCTDPSCHERKEQKQEEVKIQGHCHREIGR